MENKNSSFNFKALKYGSLSVVIVLLVIGIIVLVNAILGDLIDKGKINLKWDLTPNKLYTLGDQSKEILNQLNKEVTIYALFDKSKGIPDEYKDYVELLKQYDNYDKVNVEYIDLDKNPGFFEDIYSEKAKSAQEGDFIVQSGKKDMMLSRDDLLVVQQGNYGQLQKIGSKAETSFTGAIKRVASDVTPTIYFTQGHNEGDIDQQYTILKQTLESNNYEVKFLNLLTEEKVPDDAELLIVVSPKKDLAVVERDKMKEYFKNGGKAIFMVDPLVPNENLDNFNEVLKEYNLALNYDKVLEGTDQRYFQEPSNILVGVEQNEINSLMMDPRRFSGILMPNARSIDILKNQKELLTVTSLIKTTDQAVGKQVDSTNGSDIPGPLNIAVAAEYTGGAKPTKIVVIGNSIFLMDAVLQQFSNLNNYEFFINSLVWSVDKKDDVMIEPKLDKIQSLTITKSKANVFAILFIFVIPLLILGAGTFVWLRRRNR